MIQKIVTPGTDPVAVADLLNIAQRVANSVVLQGHIDNTGVVYVGTQAIQALALESKDTIRLYVPYRDLYIKGSGVGDKVVVTLE